MRSAEPLSAGMIRRSATLASLCFVLAGCSTLGDSLQSLKHKVSGEPAARTEPKATAVTAALAARAASAPAAAPAPAPVVVAKPEPTPEKVDHEPAVSAAAQRAFDEARRAMRAGRLADAERAFKALTVSHPELGGPHANLGLIYRQAGKTADSVAELERAVHLSPHQPVFHNQLGVAYRLNGQFTKAREAYQKSISLDADYAAPHLNLGILYDLYLWDGKRALELYDRYLALSPGGDTTVVKWVADLKNRKPQHAMLVRKEKE